MKLLALDVGNTRIGVAVGDSGIGVAAARPFVANDEHVWVTLGELCSADSIATILIGHPRSMSGAPSEQTKLTECFAKQAEEKLQLPVELVDERLTSREAHANLSAGEMKAKGHKEYVDSEAARILLQMHLDSVN